MISARESLYARLADARSDRVIFVSHCLLDENVRYLGGAFHSGAVPEAADLVRSGVGICQMPCPERLAWGGVHKPTMLRSYALRETRLYPFRRSLLRLFLWSTRVRYWTLARQVVREIEQYREAGVDVAGLIGIGASPSCGVRTTLDIKRSFATLADCPLSSLDRKFVNERAVAACRTPGEGLFIRAVRRRLRRRGFDVPFLEYDLISEMRGLPQCPFPMPAAVTAETRG